MWSTPDLSNVTLVLQDLLNQAVQTSGLGAGIGPASCDSPEIARTNNTDGQCVLTLYLLHIGRDPYWRNAPVSGPRPQLNNAQPLSLNLSYLLTAYCQKDFALEQRAMSIALQAVHSHPVMNAATTPFPAGDMIWSDLPNGEFTLSIEADTIEEMSRLWQAFTVPIRLSALIKASVVFISPLQPLAPQALPPGAVNLAVAPFAIDPTPLGLAPSLSAGFGQQTPPLPDGTTLAELKPGIGPLVAVGARVPEAGTTLPLYGSVLAIAGNALDQPGAAEVFLLRPGSEILWDVTAWRQGVAAGELDLILPGSYAVPGGAGPLNATPPPGVYHLGVGSGGVVNSNLITIAIAPRVDGVTNPPPLAADAVGVFNVSGAGFLPAAGVTLALGPATLGLTAAPPVAGGFTAESSGTAISFRAPLAMPAGTYPLLLAVNGVAASIGWLATVT